MKFHALFRWSSVLASLTLSFALATAIPHLAGASSFEGNAGYIAMLLWLPILMLVLWAMRAWGKRLQLNSMAYRVTLTVNCLLSALFLFVVAGVLF